MFRNLSDLFTYMLSHITLSIHLYFCLHAIWLLFLYSFGLLFWQPLNMHVQIL